MASQSVPFRFPTQSAVDVELVEEVPVRAGVAVTGASELEAAYGSPHPRAPGHRLVWQEPVPGRDGALLMRRTYRRLPGAELAGEAVRASSWGAAAVTTARDVPAGTPADTGLNVLESVVEPKDAQVARKRTTTVEWPVLVGRSVEPQTGTPVTVTRRMVAADAPLPEASPLTLDRKVEEVNKWRSIQIVTSLDALPAAYVEYKDRSFRFPGLFYGFDATGGGGVTKRDAFSRTVPARVEVGFAEEASEPELFMIVPVSWSYPLSFDVSDVLTNGEHFEYPVKDELVALDVPRSSPSRADYEAQIGSYVTVAGACERWKGGLWRTELWKIKLL
ncbi:MAG: hypothetical protein PHQ12_06750 [Chthoniobacteraceae bacterium]|nr:hypothetical protein [Chthoniobacteraceae bacterium]